MHLRASLEDELVNVSGVWKFRARHLLVAGLTHGESSEVPPRFTRVDRSPVPQQ